MKDGHIVPIISVRVGAAFVNGIERGFRRDPKAGVGDEAVGRTAATSGLACG